MDNITKRTANEQQGHPKNGIKITLACVSVVVIAIIAVVVMFYNNKREPVVADNYYKNTALENFETFTSVTGIDLTSSEETEGNILYNYILDDNATGIGAIAKWQQYVKEYGFTYMESLSDEDMEVYTKGEYIVCMFLSQATNATFQYVISVPKNSVTEQYSDKEISNSKEPAENQHDDYAKLVELTTSGDYQEAIDFYNNSNLNNTFEGYSDSKKYFFYAEGMLWYKKSFYGDAYDILTENCQGFLDTDAIIQKIDDKVGFLDGVYIYLLSTFAKPLFSYF